MSQENVEVVRRLYETVRTGGFGAVGDLVDPEIEWETSPNLPDAGVYRGREAVMRFLSEQADVVWGGTPVIDVEQMYDHGDEVVAFIRVRGGGSHSGIDLDVRIAQVFSVRKGRVLRGRVFPDRGKALEAVGLRE